MNDPVEVSYCVLKEGDIFGRLYRLGPPTSRHDRKEEAVLTVGGKSAPLGIPDIDVSLERPFLPVPRVWLSFGPPPNPPGPIVARIEDYRHLLQRVLLGLPDFDFLGFRLGREAMVLLDSIISLSREQTVPTTYPFRSGKSYKSPITTHHLNPSFSTRNGLPIGKNRFVDEVLTGTIEVKNVLPRSYKYRTNGAVGIEVTVRCSWRRQEDGWGS